MERYDEELLDPMPFDDYEEYLDVLARLRKAMQENADKLMELGMDEDGILLVANAPSARDCRIEEADGYEVLVPVEDEY